MDISANRQPSEVPMSYRSFAFILALAVTIGGAGVATGAAQAPGAKPAAKYVAPRTPDGRPDLQGVWSFATVTPMERPAQFAGKEFLTEAEAAAFEKQWAQDNNMDRRDGTAAADVFRAYNDFWWDRGTKVVSTRRSSLVVDPPDGRIPSQTPEALRKARERAEARRLHPNDGPEDRPLAERCILLGSGGAPMVPTFYNNNAQFFQTRDYVVIVNEMIHDARIIPLNDRPTLPQNVRQWLGDSHGHWEGDTLVVETSNFTDQTSFRGSSENMRLTERFTRV